MKKLKRQRFEALVGYSRLPHALAMSEEIAWFASAGEVLLSTILIDLSDGELIAVIFGRDLDDRYRAIEVVRGHDRPQSITRAMKSKCEKIIQSGKVTFPQGDERGKKPTFLDN